MLGLGSAYGSIAAGGGIWSSGFLTLENGTVIKRNDAQAGPGVSGGQTAGNGGAAFGGALYVAGGTLNISDTTFSGNRAVGGAGGWPPASIRRRHLRRRRQRLRRRLVYCGRPGHADHNHADRKQRHRRRRRRRSAFCV